MPYPVPSPDERHSSSTRGNSRKQSGDQYDDRRTCQHAGWEGVDGSFHDLPEINWNPEMFNFDPQDFSHPSYTSHDPSMMMVVPTAPLTTTPLLPMTMTSTAPPSDPSRSRKSSVISNSSSNNANYTTDDNITGNKKIKREDGIPETRSSPPKKVVRPCSHCGKTFVRSYDLHRHESSHSSERPYVCEHPGCTKKYKLRQDLKAHERSAHQGRGGGGAVVLGYWQGYEDRLYSM